LAASPLAAAVDAVALSHEIGVCKPDRGAYEHVLHALGVPASEAVYVGDGSNDELAGARAAGFGAVVLAEQAPRRLAAADLPWLRAQAGMSVASLAELPGLLFAEPHQAGRCTNHDLARISDAAQGRRLTSHPDVPD
jgi:putative hydrolase of the HAD superfamily